MENKMPFLGKFNCRDFWKRVYHLHEIKNIATVPEYQGKGYAKDMIDFIIRTFCEQYSVLQAGTGDSPMTIPFYEKCGFVRSHVIPNFFIDHYDHPIYECGVQLVDMVYLRRSF